MSIQTEFKNLWNSYCIEMAATLGDSEETINTKEFKDIVINDLEDKGFSKQESELLVAENSGTQETLYKIIAYLLRLYNDFNTKDELVELIKEHYDTNIDNYTDKDLDNIVKARVKIDF